MGLWHSHGSHGVFHSAVDDQTVMRLLPAMAEWNFERPRATWPVPAVTGPDTAVVPLEDGRWLRLALVGPRIPGPDVGHERAAWAHFDVAPKSQKVSPRAIHQGGSLRLVAGGLELRLGVPDGSNVISTIEDHAPIRSARLFSLVVNRRGERYAEVVSVHDLGGELHMAKRTCQVAVITGRADRRDENRMLGLATWADGLYLDSTPSLPRGRQWALPGGGVMSRFDRQETIAGWDQARLAHGVVTILGRGWLGTFLVLGIMLARCGEGAMVRPASARNPAHGGMVPDRSLPFRGMCGAGVSVRSGI